jgi:hypothetical protein
MVPGTFSVLIYDIDTQLGSVQSNSFFSVYSTITQNTGAGVQASFSAFWNDEFDFMVSVEWNNVTMYVIITVFVISLSTL